MRVHLLLTVFFASTVLARSTRDRRDTAVTTVQPPIISYTTDNGNTNVTPGDKCDRINWGNNIFRQPLKMMSKLVKSTLLTMKNIFSTFLKTLNSTGDFMLRAMMQPFVVTLRMIIRMMNWMLQFV
ncbi:uncharacterized protein LOC143906268 [Temnothorax americanus]|uniref:uncharacterized protein LOC143906268 n=1 Tax=Temnothorax americanus TaxID=1964332 RepID=UPI0040695890